MVQLSEHYSIPYDRSFNHFFREHLSFPCRLSTFVLYYNFESFSFIQIWHQQLLLPTIRMQERTLHRAKIIPSHHNHAFADHTSSYARVLGGDTCIYDFCLKEKKMV